MAGEGFITVTATANVAASPSGGVKVYADAECTQEITYLTEIDFGVFPYKVIGPGEQVQSTKSVKVWFRNEATIPVRFKCETNAPPTIVVGLPSYARTLGIGAVLPWEILVAYKGGFTGETISFKVTFGFEYIVE